MEELDVECIQGMQFVYWIGKSLVWYGVRTPYKLDCEFRYILVLSSPA